MRVRLPQLETVRYAVRCMAWRTDPTLMRCPSCAAESGQRVARKALITSLVRCESCRLLYRLPQEPEAFVSRFYDDEYRSGMTTTLPKPQTLERMLASGFKGTEKDLADKIAVLPALGIAPGARVLDFGCSWGYGVVQLAALGYRADGFEVSSTRAKWGARKLGVRIHQSDLELKPQTYDAVFTNHVLEHTRNPRVAFDLIASVLKPGGWLIAFFPNGSEACRKARPMRFQRNWGRLHPVYLNDEYCGRLIGTRPHRMTSKRYDAPVDLAGLATWDRTSVCMGDMSENELQLLAKY